MNLHLNNIQSHTQRYQDKGTSISFALSQFLDDYRKAGERNEIPIRDVSCGTP